MKYRNYSPNQAMMVPEDISEMIPPDSPVWFIMDVIDSKMLEGFETRKSEEGNPAYNPLMMTRLLVYAYYNGIFSSRKIARRARTDVEFIYLTGRQQPDFRTISKFRKNHIEFLSTLYKRVYWSALQSGLTRIGTISIDGTLIKGNVSGNKGVRQISGWREKEKKLEKEFLEYARRSSKIDEREDGEFGRDNEGGLPEKMRRVEYRRKKIAEALEKLDSEGVDEEVRINPTDPDARFIKKSDGSSYTMGYNVGLAVDENQFIMHVEMTNNSNDRPMFGKCLEGIEETLGGEIPEGTRVLGDNGTVSSENIKLLEEKKLDGYLNTSNEYKILKKKEDGNTGDKPQFTYDEERDVFTCQRGLEFTRYSSCKETRGKGKSKKKVIRIKFKSSGSCVGCPFKETCNPKNDRKILRHFEGYKHIERMKRKMAKPESLEVYKKRRSLSEPVNGDIKQSFGFRQLLVRGFEGIVEIGIMALCHNMKKLAGFVMKSISTKGLKMDSPANGCVLNRPNLGRLTNGRWPSRLNTDMLTNGGGTNRLNLGSLTTGKGANRLNLGSLTTGKGVNRLNMACNLGI